MKVPFLRVMQRWRSMVIAGVLMGALVGWVSARGTKDTSVTFEAAHTLLLDPHVQVRREIYSAATQATLGPVPVRVAARLGLDPRLVKTMVSSEFQAYGGILVITGRSADRTQAERLADVTA